MQNREDSCDCKPMVGWRPRCSTVDTMIYWEAQSSEMRVACSACGSVDTRVSFEFLCYTRHTCRTCSTTFTHSGRADHGDDAPTIDADGYRGAPSRALNHRAATLSGESALALTVFRVPPHAVNGVVGAT
jgi:hypothetical protein